MNDRLIHTYRFLIEGDAACFRRPEFVEDFVSYDVLTPLAARRVIRSVYGEDIDVTVGGITVLNPIERERTMLDGRNLIRLRDVAYRVTATLKLVGAAADDGRLDQLIDFDSHATFLGLRSLPGTISQLHGNDPPISSALAAEPPVDLGWMLFDVVGRGRARARFFRPLMIGGEIDVKRAADDLQLG